MSCSRSIALACLALFSTTACFTKTPSDDGIGSGTDSEGNESEEGESEGSTAASQSDTGMDSSSESTASDTSESTSSSSTSSSTTSTTSDATSSSTASDTSSTSSTSSTTDDDTGSTSSSSTSDDTSETSTSSTTDEDTGSSSSTSSSSSSDDTTTTDTGSTTDSESDTDTSENCDGFAGHIVYVNVDGVTLTGGIVDNAPADKTSRPVLEATWDGYTNPDLAQVFDIVRDHWSAYDVCFTHERPAALDYNMIVVTNTTYMDNPNTVSFAVPTDCDNVVANQVEVVILSDEAGLGVATKAIAISKHAARQFGLESVMSASADIMNQFIGSTLNGATFTDACLTPVMGATCNTQGTCDPGQQQAHTYLLETVGPA